MLTINKASVLFKTHGSRTTKALDSLSLKATPGEFIHVIGHNGAGKSTLVNLIAGVLKPTHGSITLDQKPLDKMSHHEKSQAISYVCQDPEKGTFPNLSIEENMALAYTRGKKCSLKKALTTDLFDHFQTLLKRFKIPLSERMQEPMNCLSGGQRQIISLLMAGLAPSRILILDEPTASLDPKTVTKALEIIQYISDTHNPIVFMISHDPALLEKMGTRTLELDNGKILKDKVMLHGSSNPKV